MYFLRESGVAKTIVHITASVISWLACNTADPEVLFEPGYGPCSVIEFSVKEFSVAAQSWEIINKLRKQNRQGNVSIL